jgi:hypothetical protein
MLSTNDDATANIAFFIATFWRAVETRASCTRLPHHRHWRTSGSPAARREGFYSQNTSRVSFLYVSGLPEATLVSSVSNISFCFPRRSYRQQNSFR